MYLLRNLRLEILAFVLVRVWYDLNPEPTNAVVKKTRSIHILPITVSLVLLRLNLEGFYIGHGFSQQRSGGGAAQGDDVKFASI